VIFGLVAEGGVIGLLVRVREVAALRNLGLGAGTDVLPVTLKIVVLRVPAHVPALLGTLGNKPSLIRDFVCRAQRSVVAVSPIDGPRGLNGLAVGLRQERLRSGALVVVVLGEVRLGCVAFGVHYCFTSRRKPFRSSLALTASASGSWGFCARVFTAHCAIWSSFGLTCGADSGGGTTGWGSARGGPREVRGQRRVYAHGRQLLRGQGNGGLPSLSSVLPGS
jgi:hypothetical protein